MQNTNGSIRVHHSKCESFTCYCLPGTLPITPKSLCLKRQAGKNRCRHNLWWARTQDSSPYAAPTKNIRIIESRLKGTIGFDMPMEDLTINMDCSKSLYKQYT
mgnify:CR=1 FL=1|jgi:hypothetical protein